MDIESHRRERDVLTDPSLRLRAAKHAALADPARLAIVDALWLGDLSPSQLQRLVSMSSNLLAHHLKVLQDAGFVTRRRSDGDHRRTYLRLVRSAAADLLPGPRPAAPSTTAVGRVVFVCTANTARSQLAEALWRRTGVTPAASAGTHPVDRVDPAAIATARRHSLPLRDRKPQPIDEVLEGGDLIVTVCDCAREELQITPLAHWSIPDPVPVGTEAAFDAVFDQLSARVDDLAQYLASSS
jgi:protein-tyrosine-phosphatase/DNA-binding transcriptional ArsR family regulator